MRIATVFQASLGYRMRLCLQKQTIEKKFIYLCVCAYTHDFLVCSGLKSTRSSVSGTVLSERQLSLLSFSCRHQTLWDRYMGTLRGCLLRLYHD